MLAEIPPEVPEIPEAALMRTDLLASIKKRVLTGLDHVRGGGSDDGKPTYRTPNVYF